MEEESSRRTSNGFEKAARKSPPTPRPYRSSVSEPDDQRRALPGSAGRFDGRPVSKGDPAREAQPQAGAAGRGRARRIGLIETLEDVREHVGPDADSGVANLENRMGAVVRNLHQNPAVRFCKFDRV